MCRLKAGSIFFLIVITSFFSKKDISLLTPSSAILLNSSGDVAATKGGREEFFCSSAILTCGTFLNGLIHIGEKKIKAGRMGEESSVGITESLKAFGFMSGRLKTGTPPRI